MAIVKDRQESFDSVEELKPLLSATGPCVSVYMTLSNASTAGRNPNAKENELRWRECLQAAEGQASQFGEEATNLLASIRNFNDVAPEPEGEIRNHQPRSIAVFQSKDVSHVIEMNERVTERAVVGQHFYIRPLVKELAHTRNFYLLAFSQKNTRLLWCTAHSAEEVAFPEGVKTDFDAWMNQTKPDHTAVYNAMAAPAQGAAGPSALAPKGADAEARDEYLSHFAKQIAGGVAQVLKGKTAPLVLCAVDYQVPIYSEVNTYPHLVPEAVYGAPNGLKSGEMHARAIEALNRCYDRKVDEALADWNHRVGGGASSHIEEVVTAAYDGRVLTLLASDTQDVTGIFDETSHTVRTKGQGRKEDLVNEAMVQTILHAGKVLVVEQSKMPDNAAVAAIYRF